jgi:hypothetical protein
MHLSLHASADADWKSQAQVVQAMAYLHPWLAGATGDHSIPEFSTDEKKWQT